MSAKQEKSENPRLVELAQAINRGHGKIEAAMRKSLEYARDIGVALLEAKGLCESDGQKYLKWVGDHCVFSVSQAQRYMRIADHWSELLAAKNGKELDKLTLVEALRILSRSGKQENAPKPASEKPKISQQDLNNHLAYADDVEFQENSPASQFVEKQAAQIARQILRLVKNEMARKDRDDKTLDKNVAALAILGKIKFSLDADLLFNVVDEVETAEVVVSDTTESTASQERQPDAEAHRRNGKGELAVA